MLVLGTRSILKVRTIVGTSTGHFSANEFGTALRSVLLRIPVMCYVMGRVGFRVRVVIDGRPQDLSAYFKEVLHPVLAQFVDRTTGTNPTLKENLVNVNVPETRYSGLVHQDRFNHRSTP